MKAVMISIQPKWCELIASGKKTIEVRKTCPSIDTPFKCYIYCTQGKGLNDTLMTADRCHVINGKVIGEFVCDRIYLIENHGVRFMIDDDIALTNRIARQSCLDFEDLRGYLGNKNGYAWHISDLKIYDTSKELGEFRPWCEKSRKTDDNLEMCCNCKNAFFDELGVFFGCGLTRPFQSWGYVEELI